MTKHSIVFLLLSVLLSSCGGFNAASNSDRSDDSNGPSQPQGDDNNTQAITVEDMPTVLNSQMFRDLGTKIYKYAQESELFRKNTLPATLHPVPDKQAFDQDRLTIRPATAQNCGFEFTSGAVTIARRINDCQTRNSSNVRAHTWDGTDNGLAGEGRWRLVIYKNGRSVWLDVATGLVWSSPISPRNWNYASGNVPESEQICNGSNDTAAKDFFLGIQADEVSWRLPTRGDFLQADLNGSRFVLSTSPQGDANVYWSANYISDSQQAWAIQHNTGILSRRSENEMLYIRCVGNVLK